MAGTISYHDRVLAMAERLVREHPKGQELLALILSGPAGVSDTSDRAETIEVVFTGSATTSRGGFAASPSSGMATEQGPDRPRR